MIGIANAIGFKQGGSQSWEDYWKSQSEVLFFGLYSEISGGQMPNKKTGSSDYLTVAGAAGSETYQCPNTASYIAADTDYIWFKTDESQRTVTTAELIGYDLQRTPVKYEDESPNEIVAIIILNAAVTGTKRSYLFRDMWLPVLWDNDLNGYGHIKDNRTGQQLWTPESVYIIQDTFTGPDGTLLRHHRPDVGLIDSTGFPDNYIYDHGYVKLSGNRAHSTATSRIGAQAIIETGVTDPDMSVDIDIPASGYYRAGIISRWKDNNEFFRITIFYISTTGGHEYCGIHKYDTLVTEVDLGSPSSGVGKLRVVWTGNFVTVYWRGNKVIDNYETDGSFNTYTAHGFYLYRYDAESFSECYIDELKIK